jgi:hypothetical protein
MRFLPVAHARSISATADFQSTDAIYCVPSEDEQAVDLGERVFDLAAQRLMRLAQVQQLAFVPRRECRSAGRPLDAGERRARSGRWREGLDRLTCRPDKRARSPRQAPPGAKVDARVAPFKGAGAGAESRGPARLIPAAACKGSLLSVEPRLLANAIRALAMDAVQAANSGHPGMPMGMADAATILFTEYLKFDPQDPKWADRDRFVLSAGHGSMLLYALLHLTGYERPTSMTFAASDRSAARARVIPKTSSCRRRGDHGPLGQGFAMVGRDGDRERHLNARFGDDLVDHRTW